MLSRANRHLSTQFSGIESGELFIFLGMAIWNRIELGRRSCSCLIHQGFVLRKLRTN